MASKASFTSINMKYFFFFIVESLNFQSARYYSNKEFHLNFKRKKYILFISLRCFTSKVKTGSSNLYDRFSMLKCHCYVMSHRSDINTENEYGYLAYIQTI